MVAAEYQRVSTDQITRAETPTRWGELMSVSRRSFLRVGSLGASLTLSHYLRIASAHDLVNSDRSAVLVFLGGGPSHLDTFDMKPDAPSEYRGQFTPIRTAVPGVEICEHLPNLARRADQYAVIRGISHSLADHGLGTRYLMTGNLPTPVVDYPMYGSVISKEFPAAPDLPSFVSIDRPVEGPGYLGAEYGPLSTGEKPRHGQPFRVRGITLRKSSTGSPIRLTRSSAHRKPAPRLISRSKRTAKSIASVATSLVRACC